MDEGGVDINVDIVENVLVGTRVLDQASMHKRQMLRRRHTTSPLLQSRKFDGLHGA